MSKQRIYVDTSVFGGIRDDEFKNQSNLFFEQIRNAQFDLVISSVVQSEIAGAPAKVVEFFKELVQFAEIVNVDEKAVKLREAYLKAGIVTGKHSNDALHVALAM